MTTSSRKHTDNRRDAILAFLRNRRDASEIAEIADDLGIHVNTVRFNLEALVASGQVERTTAGRGRPGRPPQLFAAVSGMNPAGPRNYRLLADVLTANLTQAPDPGRQAQEAGHRWGRRQAAAMPIAPGGSAATPERMDSVIDGLMNVLGEMDFAPELAEDDGLPAIALRHCPFLDLVPDRAEVICPVHLGLMRGILESWAADVTVDRLEPFTEPDRCTAHLTSSETP